MHTLTPATPLPDPGAAVDTSAPDSASAAERVAMLERVRAELRAEHARLTERQIDLIADTVVELRMTYDRLGFPQRRRP